MVGRWRGSGLPTGSPLDGLLESYGWYGKEFVDAETVHPLLFRDRAGRPRPVDPALLPVGLLRDHAGPGALADGPGGVRRRPAAAAHEAAEGAAAGGGAPRRA